MAKKDAAVGIVLLILAGLYWLGATTIRVSLLEGGVGAEALPKILAVTLVLLAGILVLQSVLKSRKAVSAEDAEADAKPFDFKRHARALGMLLIGMGYVLLVETIGYPPAIAYLLLGVTLFVGGASWRTILPFAVIGAIFFWVFFVEVLGIRQPKGFWPALWHEVVSFDLTVDAQPIAHS